MRDGWYKLTSGNIVMVRHFENGLSSNGYEAITFERIGYTFEPMVVMTKEEYDAAILDIRLYEFKRGWDAAKEGEE